MGGTENPVGPAPLGGVGPMRTRIARAALPVPGAADIPDDGAWSALSPGGPDR